MEKDCHFKINKGFYYIGDDAKTFLFIKEQKKDVYNAYFLDNNEQITSQCKLFMHEINRTIKSTKIGKIFFNYLIKIENIDKIRFDYIAEAFCHFLEENKCLSPIQASISFVDEYFKTNENTDFKKLHKKDKNPQIFKYDPNPQIMNQIFPYDKGIKYCTNPLNVFYFLFLCNENPLIFQQAMSKLSCIKENLRNLIKIIIYVCEEEIKTIDNDLVSCFVSDQIKSLESQDKILFNVIYYLLTSVEPKRMPDLMIYEFDEQKMNSETKFLRGILPRETMNSNNFYTLPAFLYVCHPESLVNQKIDYGFSKQQELIVDSVISNWEKYLEKKQGKKWYSFTSSKVDLKTNFKSFIFNQSGIYKNNLKSFNYFIIEIYKGLPKSAKKDLQNIKKELCILSKNLAEVVNDISEYPYEDLRASVDDLKELYKNIHLKTNGDPSIFWTVLNEGDLQTVDYNNRSSIFAYIKSCFNSPKT